MTAKDYRIAYKFLKIRATESGSCAPFRVTHELSQEQQSRIYNFLRNTHQVKFI